MPRFMANESEDDYEPKTGRKTRAALAAAVTDSPVRRSTRNRQGSVNPDGSSPESITGSAAMITTRVTRRRGAAAAAATELTNAPEPHRALRSRRNSASSNISENLEPESAPGTPKTRAIKPLSIVESSPGTPKLGIKTRRSTRASSETKSPPPPVRTTRRTRATSIDPEPNIERVIKSAVVSTPTKKRRQQVSALPTEPVLTEEDNEDKTQQETEINIVVTIPEEEIESESSPDKISIETSSRSPTPNSKKSPKKDRNDGKQKDDESLDGKSLERSSVTEILPAKDKFRIDEQEEIELLKTPDVGDQAKAVSAGNIEVQISPKLTETSTIKTKRHSLDKSRELGMKIEDLLNKSTEEQEKSPGNKENEKLNVSPEKVKKNLEFTVSNVNIPRGKSLGVPRFLNKSADKKINSSLDERVLSKSRFDIEASKSFEVDNKSLNTAKDSQESSPGKKSVSELPNAVESPKKTGNQEAEETESAGERSGSKTSYTKIDETIVENEVIEEFTLDDSESEFSLTVEDDVEGEKRNIDEASRKQQSIIITERSESESSCDIFDVPNPLKNNSRKNSIEGVEGKKQNTPKKKTYSYSKEAGESSEVSMSDNKQDKRKEFTGKIDGKETDLKTKDLGSETISEEDIDQEEAMDTNEQEEVETEDKSQTVSPRKKSSDKEMESLKAKEPETEVSDSDANIVIDNLFQNISAEEWNKKKGEPSPKESKKKRKSSMKSLALSEETDSEDDFIPVSEKSWKGIEDSDSDDTLILKKNDSAKKANKKKRSDVKPIHKEAESEDELMEVSVESKKSPNKSRRSNTSVGNSSNGRIQIKEVEDDEKNSEAKSQNEEKEGPEIDDDISEAETIPSNTDNIRKLDENSASKDVEKEKEPASSKSTPKNLKNKSKKSSDVYEFEDDSEDEEMDDKTTDDSTDEKEETELVNPKLRSQTKKRLGLLDKQPLTPMDKNHSTIAVVDSESDSGANLMPGYLFSVDSSDDEDYIAEEDSIDSDIAKELNLAGTDDLEYSDDNVIADDCNNSESEYSEETDTGSDLDDFVVLDDEVESSDVSEEETSVRAKFKRILDKSSSEDEEGDVETVTKNTDEKLKEDVVVKSPELLGKRLNFSYESDIAASDRKTKKGKIVPNLIGESEISVSPGAEVPEKKSDKKLNKFSKPLRSLLDTTIDLCTPEANSITRTKNKNNRQSPGLNSSLDKKLKKNLIQDLGTPIAQDSNRTQQDEDDDEEENEKEEEKQNKSVITPQTKTPNKEKKTPNKPHDINKMQEDEDEEEETESAADSVFTPQTKTPNKKEKTPNKPPNSNKTQEDEKEEDEEDEDEEEEEWVFPLQTKSPNKERITPNKEKKTPNKEKKTPNKETKTPNKETKTPNEETKTPDKEKKTPNTDKKAPKSAKKNTRDSMQLIEDAAVLKSSVSDLNKSMLTPNSESPVTKFLKKERLNESLPLLELKKRMSKTFDRKTLNKMDEDEQETDDASETEEPEEANEESGNEENNENDDVEEVEDEVNANGHKDDEDEDETDKEEEKGDVNEDNDHQLEDQESEESSEEEMSKKRKTEKKNKNKTKTPIKAVKTPEIKADQQNRKSGGRKSVSEVEDVSNKNGTDITPNKKDLAKRLSTASITEKNTEMKEDIVSRNKKRHLSTPGTELPTRKKRARLESSETPLGPKDKKKSKLVAKTDISLKDNKDEVEAEDDDEAPESLGFGQARTAALKEMKDVASSLKAAKEAKKKKRRDQLERIKAEKESKMGKKSTSLDKTDPATAKTNLKRLPEELLDNLTDEPQRPKKKRKLTKKDEKIVPSRYMFSPGKPLPSTLLKIEDNSSPVSTTGGTTHFSVMNLEKVKKQPKKAAAVASFRDIMLARNPRQPVSAFLVYKAKQKASGKQLSSRKQA